ncbi:MAG: NAD-dependent epimerase/dehydratase family protein [Chloroflexi bacterium]|nr:NAD-dependent epimerase/dehydratase family protein [Chloroflexota bacterium]
MRYLVTGGAGFLGAALANQLSHLGHEVRVLDDLSSGEKGNLHAAVHLTRGDVNDIPKLWSLLQDVDCVYHLAARVSVAESILYPRDYNYVNVGGTVSLMEAIRDAGVRRVVLTSSGAVYGSQPAQPVPETAVPAPDSPYAVSKLAAEQYLHTIGQLWGIETVALRIFNAYGPGQNLPVSHAPVVPRFLKQAATGGSVVLFGNGQQTRDFVYVTDVVEALIRAATAARVDKQVINVGSGVETSLSGLVDVIEQLLGKSVSRIANPAKASGVSRLTGDLERAKQLLGYVPRISLAEGLRQTLTEDVRFGATAVATL